MFLERHDTTIELINATSAIRKFAGYWLMIVIVPLAAILAWVVFRWSQLLQGDVSDLLTLGGMVGGLSFMVWLGLKFYLISDVATKFDLIKKIVTIKTQPQFGLGATLVLPFENIKSIGLVKIVSAEGYSYSIELNILDGSQHQLCLFGSSRELYGPIVDEVCAATNLARADRD